MGKIKIHVGGVPEHYNLPWRMAVEKGEFTQNGIDLKWSDFPGGTGAMCAALREGKLDVAVLLTEGIITDISKGNPSSIVQFYVDSSLRWGIHVAANSDINTLAELKDKKFAISRLKSGSHLMSFVNARNHGWKIKEDQFEIVGDLTGARKSMRHDPDLGFLWERFTTKPFVDAGEFKHLGDCLTPWPCFVIAVSNDFLNKNEEALSTMLDIINASCQRLMELPEAVEIIADRYQLEEEDTAEWFSQVKWTAKRDLKEDLYPQVMDTLIELGILENKIPVEELCHRLPEASDLDLCSRT